MKLLFSCVSEPPVVPEPIHEPDGMLRHIESIAGAFNIRLRHVEQKKKTDDDTNEHTTDNVSTCQLSREDDPLNEFEEMQDLLTGAFPTVFLLGKSYTKNSLLNAEQMEHLLCQFTTSAARQKSAGGNKEDRRGKFFGIFNIVSFPNDVCNGTNDMQGEDFRFRSVLFLNY